MELYLWNNTDIKEPVIITDGRERDETCTGTDENGARLIIYRSEDLCRMSKMTAS